LPPVHHHRHHSRSGHPGHHHGDQPPPNKMSRGNGGMGGGSNDGMPSPAPRPRGPKIKFTPEDDSLLVDLKENKSLTWKQIAEYFPGRSSGTLQVRYCTKLKAKTTVWSDETIQKLRTAMSEYEQDRWRHIAAKVGSGFSPAACRDKAREI
ncbi:MYB DNA-binding domain protein, partial [Pyronema omphalodes]